MPASPFYLAAACWIYGRTKPTNSCRLLVPAMTLIKLKEKEGDPQSVVNQLRALMTHFNRLVEDDGLVKRFWGHVRRRLRFQLLLYDISNKRKQQKSQVFFFFHFSSFFFCSGKRSCHIHLYIIWQQYFSRGHTRKEISTIIFHIAKNKTKVQAFFFFS